METINSISYLRQVFLKYHMAQKFGGNKFYGLAKLCRYVDFNFTEALRMNIHNMCEWYHSTDTSLEIVKYLWTPYRYYTCCG